MKDSDILEKILYVSTDQYLEKLKIKIRQEINHVLTLGFDELSAIHTKRLTIEIYERLKEFNLSEYKKIARQARVNAQTVLAPDEIKKLKNQDDDETVEDLLMAYNYVTGYLYDKEADRKRLRMGEEIMTAREFNDRDYLRKQLKRSADLWYTQSGQYAQDIEDTVLRKTYEEAGIKRVMWVTEHDERVCKVCEALDGNIYPIHDAPRKQHYHCRCFLVPVRD